MVRTLEAAAAWVDEVGLALLFPKADVVLPSLWEQVNGSPERQLGGPRAPTGRSCAGPRRWASSGARRTTCPPQGLVCVGKHVARVATCVAPRLVPLLVAARERAGAALRTRRRSSPRSPPRAR